MELIDIVTEKNETIGTSIKSEAHKYGYAHGVASIFIFNRKGLILVNKRADDSHYDHSVGGHIRSGEQPVNAAQREGLEEVGLPGSTELFHVGSFFLDESSRGPLIRHFFYLYKAEVEKDFVPKPQIGEVIALEWWPMNALCEMMKLEPRRFSLGFLGTMNFYLSSAGLPFGPIALV